MYIIHINYHHVLLKLVTIYSSKKNSERDFCCYVLILIFINSLIYYTYDLNFSDLVSNNLHF